VGEKTEQATPRKLQQGRKKGQVAKSQDFPSAFTFVVAIGTVVGMTGMLYEQLAGLIVSFFRMASLNLDWQSLAGGLLYTCGMTIFTASIPIVVITLLVGVLINFLIVGPMWASEALKFDLKKLNPVDNIKQKFKARTLLELLKSILKIAGAAYLVYTVVRNALPEVLATVQMPIVGSALILQDFLQQVIIKVGVFFVAIAVADLAFQKRFFAKEMMMEKHEVKQEYKDTEGDPHIKGKRRQLAQEAAYQDPGVVRKARAVVTNPTHIAVAIGFEKHSPAPFVLAMGVGVIAEQIIQIAEQAGIPIVRNVPLAHSLREKANVNEYIPEELYEPMAEVLRLVFSLNPELDPFSKEES
jgi:type III secretion protein U